MSKQLIDNASRKNVFMMDPREVLIAGIDFGDETHPMYDPRIKLPIDPTMVESIKGVGVRMNVTAIVLEDGKVLCSDGRRRVLHNRLANDQLSKIGEPIRLIPVMAEKANEATTRLAPLLGEHLNNHRVNDLPLVKAEKSARLLARGYSYEDVALSMAVDVATIKNYEKLLGLSSPVKKAVNEGRLTPSAACKLAGLSAEEQTEKLQELLASTPAGKKISTRQVVEAKGGSVAPGRKTLKQVIAAADALGLSDDFVRGVRLALGDVSAEDVEWLKKIESGLLQLAAKQKVKE